MLIRQLITVQLVGEPLKVRENCCYYEDEAIIFMYRTRRCCKEEEMNHRVRLRVEELDGIESMYNKGSTMTGVRLQI